MNEIRISGRNLDANMVSTIGEQAGDTGPMVIVDGVAVAGTLVGAGFMDLAGLDWWTSSAPCT